ncbi:MAG TPA: MBL fold metallo-hydrolase [Acidimicrobiia bacterium]|nr:MBL fold metallo-hydrolase [Acidimicrobiia bacterium]
MKATFWGTRGSLPSPRPGTTRYGGNTSCVEVRTADGSVVLLDAGSGVHRLAGFGPATRRVDILLSHLHMDHILGLGFFGALFQPDLEVHIWGPPSTTLDLRARLSRYLSPPLFPVRLTDLPCKLTLHDAPRGTFDLPSASVTADLVCHPGPTLGYRLEADGATLTYIPDHEPALGDTAFLASAEWTSGFALMAGVDLLIHDAQYTDEEYPAHVGWGHSTISQTMALAQAAGVGVLAPFHHDPNHNDVLLDRLFSAALEEQDWSFELSPAREGTTLTLGRHPALRS